MKLYNSSNYCLYHTPSFTFYSISCMLCERIGKCDYKRLQLSGPKNNVIVTCDKFKGVPT